jgi:hypothetical protein
MLRPGPVPAAAAMRSALAVRVHIPRLGEMNDLHRDNCQVWWHYTSSSSVHRDVAYGSFARRCGRLMEITTGVDNARDIQALSMVPSEGELLILPNTDFKVKLALSCGQARLLNARYATIPDHMGIMIPEAAPPDASSSRLRHVPLCHGSCATSTSLATECGDRFIARLHPVEGRFIRFSQQLELRSATPRGDVLQCRATGFEFRRNKASL